MAENINISDLSFEGIRTSLIDYLRTQEVFKDYDFEGSAIRTIVDLLAYNTFYYGYYANMIANETFLDTAKLENSMISLTKPLGYLVPKYYSSRTQARLTNIISSGTISRFSIFKGFANSGRPYFFYNITPITVLNSDGIGETDYFDLFEGRSVTNRQLVSVNLNSQSFVLEGDRIDPRTIIVEVQETEGADYSEWLNYLTNPDSIVGPNTEIFFVERTKTGYRINFGKQTSSDISSSNTGKMIEQENKVYVSYLASSGEDANNISSVEFVADGRGLNIRTPTTQIFTLYPSKNGISTPNLEEIRFFAPKSFAKQNRLVTKSDYYAILNELGYGSGNENPDFSYKVFGGEEASPPIYGRVFVSLIDLNLIDDLDYSQTEQINQILSVLKNKSVVSILPEYLPPLEYKVSLIISGTLSGANEAQLSAAKQAIKTRLFARYGTRKYNQDIIEDDIIEECRSAVPNLLLSLDESGVFVKIQTNLSESQNIRKINFKNTLNSVKITQTGSTIYAKNSGNFMYLYGQNNALYDLVPVGEFMQNEGVVILYAGKMPGSLTVEAEPTNDVFYAKDEIVSYIQSDANINTIIN